MRDESDRARAIVGVSAETLSDNHRLLQLLCCWAEVERCLHSQQSLKRSTHSRASIWPADAIRLSMFCMIYASHPICSLIKPSRPFSTSVARTITKIQIRLPQQLSTQYSFLRRFQISLLVDPQRTPAEFEGKENTNRGEKMSVAFRS